MSSALLFIISEGVNEVVEVVAEDDRLFAFVVVSISIPVSISILVSVSVLVRFFGWKNDVIGGDFDGHHWRKII